MSSNSNPFGSTDPRNSCLNAEQLERSRVKTFKRVNSNCNSIPSGLEKRIAYLREQIHGKVDKEEGEKVAGVVQQIAEDVATLFKKATPLFGNGPPTAIGESIASASNILASYSPSTTIRGNFQTGDIVIVALKSEGASSMTTLPTSDVGIFFEFLAGEDSYATKLNLWYATLNIDTSSITIGFNDNPNDFDMVSIVVLRGITKEMGTLEINFHAPATPQMAFQFSPIFDKSHILVFWGGYRSVNELEVEGDFKLLSQANGRGAIGVAEATAKGSNISGTFNVVTGFADNQILLGVELNTIPTNNTEGESGMTYYDTSRVSYTQWVFHDGDWHRIN